MQEEPTHINLNINPVASQPSTIFSLTFMDYLGGTLEGNREPNGEGPNDDGCDLENYNNVNPQCPNSTLSYHLYPCFSDLINDELVRDDLVGKISIYGDGQRMIMS